jgi:hypothetical protein
MTACVRCFSTGKTKGEGEGRRHLVDVAEDDLLDGRVLERLADDAAVAAANDEDLLRVRVAGHREVTDHLLVPAPRVSRARALPLRSGTHENSSRSVHWMTPSRTRTFPYVALSNTSTSWYCERSTCRIFVTLRVIACPGHCDEISRNQPSKEEGIRPGLYQSYERVSAPTIEGWVWGAMVGGEEEEVRRRPRTEF